MTERNSSYDLIVETLRREFTNADDAMAERLIGTTSHSKALNCVAKALWGLELCRRGMADPQPPAPPQNTADS